MKLWLQLEGLLLIVRTMSRCLFRTKLLWWKRDGNGGDVSQFTVCFNFSWTGIQFQLIHWWPFASGFVQRYIRFWGNSKMPGSESCSSYYNYYDNKTAMKESINIDIFFCNSPILCVYLHMHYKKNCFKLNRLFLYAMCSRGNFATLACEKKLLQNFDFLRKVWAVLS